MLHGNLYKMKDGLYMGRLYNQLPHDGITLDGHYTILFTYPELNVYCYKHGDYGNLISYLPVDFGGFLVLNGQEVEYLKEKCLSFIERKPCLYGTHRYVSEAHFEYDYEIQGMPDYMQPFIANN